VCDRILIIREGEIVADDALERLSAQAQRGGETVRVAVPAAVAGEEVAAALAAATSVHAVTHEGDGMYTVDVSDAAQAAPSLAAAVVEHGWPLLELSPVHLTLRDIYMQATSGVIETDSADDDDSAEPLDAAIGGPEDGEVEAADADADVEAEAETSDEDGDVTASADEDVDEKGDRS
jgi:hypothetical protein